MQKYAANPTVILCRPKNAHIYLVRLQCKLGEVVVEQHDELSVVIGDEQVVPGVEKALESMKLGETSRFTIAPAYAYGSTGKASQNIPPNSNLVVRAL